MARVRNPIAARGLAYQWRTVLGDRQHGLLAGQRFAQDIGEEPRCRLIRLAGAHAYRRQPDADSIEKAAPRIIRKQQFADRLLRAVARERRREILIADRIGKRRAEYRNRR